MIEFISFHQVDKIEIKNLFEKYYKGSKNLLICGAIPMSADSGAFERKIKNFNGITILFNLEPMSRSGGYDCKGYKEKWFNYYLGCFPHKPERNQFKFPYYLLKINSGNNAKQETFPHENPHFFNTANNFVKFRPNTGLGSISKMKFCALINSWDPDNVRTCMFRKLKTINVITCPGKLFNNASTAQLNEIGKIKYLRNFTFSICSENYDTENIPGYITEKLMDACLAGCIPIYSGWFAENDAKIFNRNRILFYHSQSPESIQRVYNKIIELKHDRQKFDNFYRQPIFCESAFETVERLRNDFFNKINNL